MTLKETILHDIKQAMRDKAQSKLDALRLISAAIKQIEVDERIEVNDERALIILDKLAKQRKESITQFKAAHREDLVEKEQFELDIIQTYLPPALSQEELNTYIAEAIHATGAAKMADMGKVMAILKPQIQGRCDMSEISSLIKAKLS